MNNRSIAFTLALIGGFIALLLSFSWLSCTSCIGSLEKEVTGSYSPIAWLGIISFVATLLSLGGAAVVNKNILLAGILISTSAVIGFFGMGWIWLLPATLLVISCMLCFTIYYDEKLTKNNKQHKVQPTRNNRQNNNSINNSQTTTNQSEPYSLNTHYVNSKPKSKSRNFNNVHQSLNNVDHHTPMFINSQKRKTLSSEKKTSSTISVIWATSNGVISESHSIEMLTKACNKFNCNWKIVGSKVEKRLSNGKTIVYQEIQFSNHRNASISNSLVKEIVENYYRNLYKIVLTGGR